MCGACSLEAMKAAQFSSRGATPHEEQALLKQAKSLAAASQATGAPANGRGSRGVKAGRGRGGLAGKGGRAPEPESPQASAAAAMPQDPSIADASEGVLSGWSQDKLGPSSRQILWHACDITCVKVPVH